MWVKRYDYYMDEVYFQNEHNTKVRVLRFTHNLCVDSVFASMQGMKGTSAEVEVTHRLNHTYSEYISPMNEFDSTKNLERLIQEADFHFKVPDAYLGES